MRRETLHIGLLVSALLHLSLFAMAWLASNRSSNGEIGLIPVPVQLSMFHVARETIAASRPRTAEDFSAQSEASHAEPRPMADRKYVTEATTPPENERDSPGDAEPVPEQPAHQEAGAAEMTPVRAQPPEAPPSRREVRPGPTATRQVSTSSKTTATSGQVTPAAPATTTPPVSPKTIPSDLPGYTDAHARALRKSYLAELSARIDANKRYPRKARRRGQEGTVIIYLTVEADGSCSEVRIADSSGYQQLDSAALAAVNDASPFSPFPSGLRRDRWNIRVPLVFHLRR